MFILGPAEGTTSGLGSVSGGCMRHQCAPAAADVEEPLARLQIELAADVVKFG